MGLCGTAYAKLCPRDGIPKSDCLEMNCPSGVCWEDENLHGECCPFVKDLPRLGEACTECGCAQGPCLNGKCICDGPEEVVLNGHKAASCKDSRNKLIRWENNSSCRYRAKITGSIVGTWGMYAPSTNIGNYCDGLSPERIAFTNKGFPGSAEPLDGSEFEIKPHG